MPQREVDKIELMGAEIKDKCGVGVYVVAKHTLNGAKIYDYEENITKKLVTPYILFTLITDDKQVDVACSPKACDMIDREQILSPFPWSGAIIPILAQKKSPSKFQAALLNGYAEITDQVASSCDIEFENSIGSQNRTVYTIVKIIFYGTIFGIFFYALVYRRYLKKD
jgi:hypothetical protein